MLRFRNSQLNQQPLCVKGSDDIQPGKHTIVQGIGIILMREDKTDERWGMVDILPLLQRLGALPQPSACRI